MVEVVHNIPTAVELNVGGREFVTTWATLSSKGDNFLTLLVRNHYSGRIPSVLVNGSLFIDQNPDVFEVVLDYLRTGKLFLIPKVSEERLMHDLEFYRIAVKNRRKKGKKDQRLNVAADIKQRKQQGVNALEELMGPIRQIFDSAFPSIWKVLAESFAADRKSYCSIFFFKPLRFNPRNGNRFREQRAEQEREWLLNIGGPCFKGPWSRVHYEDWWKEKLPGSTVWLYSSSCTATGRGSGNPSLTDFWELLARRDHDDVVASSATGVLVNLGPLPDKSQWEQIRSTSHKSYQECDLYAAIITYLAFQFRKRTKCTTLSCFTYQERGNISLRPKGSKIDAGWAKGYGFF